LSSSIFPTYIWIGPFKSRAIPRQQVNVIAATGTPAGLPAKGGAHPIATRAEQAAVRAAGISWDAYDRFMRMYSEGMESAMYGRDKGRGQTVELSPNLGDGRVQAAAA
jgi:hypothetical protein